jgi:tRNA (cmo5U34)-methyltransferase
LHQLREETEWRDIFAKIFRALKPGGSNRISDLITQSTEAVESVMWQRYGEYLTNFKDAAYREQVFAYIAQEDTPRPVLWQLNLLQETGFGEVEILHKNSSFAAFGAIKS